MIVIDSVNHLPSGVRIALGSIEFEFVVFEETLLELLDD